MKATDAIQLSAEKLQKTLRAGDAEAITKIFRGANEAQRQSVSPIVKNWGALLELNWRSQFDRAAAARAAQQEVLKNWSDLMPAADVAALASLSLPQIKSLHLAYRAEMPLVVEALRDRNPAWLDDYAAHMVNNWKLVRLLIRKGICRPPAIDAYALNAISGIWPQFDLREHLRRKDAGEPPLPEPNLTEILLAERDWLDSAFWRLFEVEGTSEVSLANGEKYGSQQSWTSAIVELSQRGVLSRERLLDASLAALSRDFIQFRAGWFSRFHEALTPTAEERAQRLPVYFQLLGSSIPPTITFALKAVQALDKAKPIPGAQLARHLESALAARSKAAVTGALQLLDRAARREKHFGEPAARVAVTALLHESPEVQEKTFDFLEKHGRADDVELCAKLDGLGEHIAPSLRKRLAPWLGKTAKIEAKPAPGKDSLPSAPPSRLDPARALTPIAILDELILAASAMVESPENPMEIERVLEGLSRLGAERPPDFDKRVGPLRKRALKKRDDQQGSYPRHPDLDRGLAMLLLTWTDDLDGFTEEAVKLGRGQNHFAFLFRRLKVLGDFLRQRKSLPLLSAPTHQGGWIAPRVLVERWLAWQANGSAPDLHEQVLALLRLAPEGSEAALRTAREVKGESGEALCFALGSDGRTGKNAALWLAAWRSRQPHGDLPEFEKVHPKLGPDAGVAACYEWQANGKRHELQNSTWNSLEFSFSTLPKVPGNMDDALLPVLTHGKWETSVENAKNQLRWASTLWPTQRESFFAQGIKPIAWAVNSADAMDRDLCSYVEPLAEPHTEMRPVATLALALGLAAEDAALRGHAQEGLIAAITQGRVDVPALAAVMARLLATGINKFARWGKTLREAARVSPLHTAQIAGLLSQSLRGDPAKAPRDIYALLELLVELLAETSSPINDLAAREYLREISASGRTAKLVKQLLG